MLFSKRDLHHVSAKSYHMQNVDSGLRLQGRDILGEIYSVAGHHLVGYVELPATHPWAEGVGDTWDSNINIGRRQECTFRQMHSETGKLVVGFDCAHYSMRAVANSLEFAMACLEDMAVRAFEDWVEMREWDDGDAVVSGGEDGAEDSELVDDLI